MAGTAWEDRLGLNADAELQAADETDLKSPGAKERGDGLNVHRQCKRRRARRWPDHRLLIVTGQVASGRCSLPACVFAGHRSRCGRRRSNLALLFCSCFSAALNLDRQPCKPCTEKIQTNRRREQKNSRRPRLSRSVSSSGLFVFVHQLNSAPVDICFRSLPLPLRLQTAALPEWCLFRLSSAPPYPFVAPPAHPLPPSPLKRPEQLTTISRVEFAHLIDPAAFLLREHYSRLALKFARRPTQKRLVERGCHLASNLTRDTTYCRNWPDERSISLPQDTRSLFRSPVLNAFCTLRGP